MKRSDFFYDLPKELIAQTPLEKRDTSRLLVMDRVTGEVKHQHFYDIIDYLQPGDCLVMNDSRVLPARLLGHRPTGGAVEVLLLRDLGNKQWECLCKPGRKMQVGNQVRAIIGTNDCCNQHLTNYKAPCRYYGKRHTTNMLIKTTTMSIALKLC